MMLHIKIGGAGGKEKRKKNTECKVILLLDCRPRRHNLGF